VKYAGTGSCVAHCKGKRAGKRARFGSLHAPGIKHNDISRSRMSVIANEYLGSGILNA
jgi:hypothetical protein